MKYDEETFDPREDYRKYEPVEVVDPHPAAPMVLSAIDEVLTQCQLERKRAFMPHSRTGGPREAHCLHPSQLAGCPRKAQFVFLNAERDPRPPDPRLERMFDMGHEAHRRIQGYLFEAWKRKIGGITRVWEDVKLKIPDLVISGELDAVVEMSHKRRFVVEIKTVGKSVWDRLTGPKKEWVWQAAIYAKAIGLTEAYILVECRDNGDMQGFYIKVTPELWSSIEDQALEVICHTINQELAPVNPEPGECNWCNYKNVCKSPRVQQRISWIDVKEPEDG